MEFVFYIISFLIGIIVGILIVLVVFVTPEILEKRINTLKTLEKDLEEIEKGMGSDE